MIQAAADAQGNFLQARSQLEKALANTPDDRLNWSPSPHSRSVVQQVAHCACSLNNITSMLKGKKFSTPDTATADKEFMKFDSQFTTREEVLALLDKHSGEYIDWLEGLSEEQLDRMVPLPFDMGEAPTSVALAFNPMHINYHVAQIDYMQTIYGDRDWHL